MTEAQTSGAEKPKRKRRRPARKQREGLIYGDPDAKSRDLDRQLTPEEIMLLAAEWQRTGGRIDKAAKVVRISESRANDIVVRYIKEHPDVLEDPDMLLRVGNLMGEIQALALERAKENMKDVYGKPAVMTAWIAGQKRDACYKAWKERVGAAGTEDVEKLSAEAEAVDEELARFEDEGGVTAGQAAPQAATPRGEAESSLGEDAGQGGDD